MNRIMRLLTLSLALTSVLIVSADTCGTPTLEKRPLTKTESAIVGIASSGLFHVTLGQPLGALLVHAQLANKGEAFWKNLTIQGLYTRGLTANLATIPFNAALQQISNTFFSEQLRKHNNNQPLSDAQKIAAGAGAGIISTALVTPTNCVFIEAQKSEIKKDHIPTKQRPSTLDFMRSIWRKGGLAGFYRGATVTATKQAIGTASYLAAFPSMKQKYLHVVPNDVIATCASGLTVGIPTAILTHPFDVVETQLVGDPGKKKYKSIFDAFKDTWNSGKIFAGLKLRLARTIIGTTVIGRLQEYFGNKIQEFNSTKPPKNTF